MGQLSQPVLEGLEILAQQAGGLEAVRLQGMLLAMDATQTRRWTPDHERRLAELEREAGRRTAQDEPLPDRAVAAAVLAWVHGTRLQQLSSSPRPAEHPSAGEFAAVVTETESSLELLAQAAAAQPGSVWDQLSAPVRAHTAIMLVGLSEHDGPHRAELLARARTHFDLLPAGMLDQMPVLREMAVLEQLIEGVIPPDDPAVDAVTELSPNVWDGSGGDLRRAQLAAARARQSRAPEDIGTALKELQAVWLGLSAGSPLRSQVLASMAMMQSTLAVQSGQRGGTDAAGTAIAAVRAATVPAEVQGAAQLLITILTLMLSRGERQGPFREAEDGLRTAMAGASADDWGLRTTLLTGIGAAAAMRSALSGDEDLRATARQAIADAEHSLPDPEPTDRWCTAAKVLCTWAAVEGLYLAGTESASLALRLIGTLETVLAAHPGLTQEVVGSSAGPDIPAAPSTDLQSLRQLRQQLQAAPRQPAPGSGPDGQLRPAPETELATMQEAKRAAHRALDQAATGLGIGDSNTRPRRPLAATGRPDPGALRPMAADLHQALAGTADDTRLRQQVDRMLGICSAELYWAAPAEEDDQALREAVVHLNRALLAGEHALPTVEWADMLDVLARCLREAAQRYEDPQTPGTAERVARAALRELAYCVMVAEDADRAVSIAARANEIVARAVGWCLADSRPRAAVDIAETGRGLVLASVTLSGRVEEILRGGGQDEAADAWRAGDGTGRSAVLDALLETTAGDALLSTPIGEEISVTMTKTPFDAVVYLVPPAEPDSAGGDPGAPAARAGQALLVRPVFGQIEVVPLPELAGAGTGTPLDAYRAALDRALAEFDPKVGSEDGFRGTPTGQAWADALEEVGRWAYTQIMGPVLDHVRDWSLDHMPHLALIPLGGLAAIPYAAAWTESPAAGDRCYAIDQAVLSYAASARLLGETARRPRQPPSERVVLMSDPTGGFPMTRRATRLLASRQYPGAEVYGLKSDRNGPATTSALLDAFPARDRPGASLLQLTMHGTTDPTPRLEAKDGPLPLATILGQARDRAPDAPGGLVITNACLTDSTRTHYDESLTLATAFLAAGATAVIGTRWPVDDDTTAALALRLHYHLQVGCQPAEALRRAQRDLIRPTPGMRATLGQHLAALPDARLSHPATWAGHVHHGI